MDDLQRQAEKFDDVQRVVADPLRFKLRLGIGEDAYASLKLKKSLKEIWDVGGMAATGAGVAASPLVATTFFASTASGGFLSVLGLGTAAATPIGWVVAAAVVSGGAYLGVTRLFRNYAGARVETIPRFLNTPMDLLGANLFDLMGSLAVRLGQIDGRLDESEVAVIKEHFVTDWGLDALYVDRAFAVVAEGAERHGLKAMAGTIAAFQAANPDCNPVAMHRELMRFLRDVAEADGVVDEREELALEAIAAVLRTETEFSLRNAGRTLNAWSRSAGGQVRDLAGRIAARSRRRSDH